MDKNTKITLAELIKRKEQVLEAKKNVKRARVYVKSLGGEIVIKAPTKSLATESAEMEKDGDAHLVYECVAEPDLHSKELQEAYGCTYPVSYTHLDVYKRQHIHQKAEAEVQT